LSSPSSSDLFYFLETVVSSLVLPPETDTDSQSPTIKMAVASTNPDSAPRDFKRLSSSLPLGQRVGLSSISGPTYVTAQVLVQQIAYKLSDKIFSYSPETFDLDIAAKDWAANKETNIHGYTTSVIPLQTRTGAGAFALGYINSPDFDIAKRNIPQSLLAPSLSLRHLRSALDQLSLLYGVASPFVAHVAAADYSAQNGLVAEYGAALQIAEELGLGLVTSSSAYETQHMSLFATLLAAVLPTIHIYDGVRTSRETLRVVDVMGGDGVAEVYNNVLKSAQGLSKRLDNAGKTVELLKAFNQETGTDYQPFEYYGHDEATTVLVVFGSVESQLAKQVVEHLAAAGEKIGAVSVRIYRPFIEEAFLKVLPASTQQVAVLGQVRDDLAVEDASVQSVLYSDVLTAVAFSDKWQQAPAVVEVKYAASEALTPSAIASKISKVASKGTDAEQSFTLNLSDTQQYTFWDLDNSTAANAPSVVGKLLTQESKKNVYVHESHDNLIQGGIIRTDIRSAPKPIEAPYAVDQADIVFVGEEKLLKGIPLLNSVKTGGKVILRLPNFKEDDLEKRIPDWAKKTIHNKAIELYVLDTSYSPALEKDSQLLVELAFTRIARPEVTPEELVKLRWIAQESTLKECVDALAECFKKVEIPATWVEIEAESAAAPAEYNVKLNSFAGFEKTEEEETLQINDWQSAAKGLAFKEVYGTQTGLRPDLSTQTFTIHVKENRRLTPDSYDRNIFHIEFDLGNSGLTYKIGEALGIHADNDPVQIEAFIKAYGLNANDLVQVPNRIDPTVLDTRTVYQSLLQNLDILGKPPKRFFEMLAEFATDEAEKKKLENLGGAGGAEDFKKLTEVDTVTYIDVLEEFQSAHPSIGDLVRLVSPLKRREYSIASAQAVTPTSVSLMIVVVDWTDPKGRTRFGQATRFLSSLKVGTPIIASVKPSVMKLPTKDTAPLIMAGLGTGLAPFRAFIQYRAMQKAQGKEIGAILLYLGSRHQREEYLYGEEWEAYMDAGVITLLGAAFSRDQPQKIYIQDRMRETQKDIVKAYIEEEGSFYLCGPTWPVPDVTEVLQEAIAAEAKASGRKVDPRKEIERLKEDGRYVLEVY
jgi:sulfite reductase (NADPH) flavoprotein alpha-component